jgi:hypothetical protein
MDAETLNGAIPNAGIVILAGAMIGSMLGLIYALFTRLLYGAGRWPCYLFPATRNDRNADQDGGGIKVPGTRLRLVRYRLPLTFWIVVLFLLSCWRGFEFRPLSGQPALRLLGSILIGFLVCVAALYRPTFKRN